MSVQLYFHYGMDVSGNIKGSFDVAANDLKFNFQHKNERQLTRQLFKAEDYTGNLLVLKNKINWKDIHEKTEECDMLARVCDNLVKQLTLNANVKSGIIAKFFEEISYMKQLEQTVEKTKHLLTQMCRMCKNLEKSLIDLEVINENWVEMKSMNAQNFDLDLYRMIQMKQLENSKASLAECHKNLTEKHEEQIKLRLMERMKVFELAHIEEMEKYKKSGLQIEQMVSGQDTHSMDLEDIKIDYDPSELEMFLTSNEHDTDCSHLEGEISETESSTIPLFSISTASIVPDTVSQDTINSKESAKS